jgi:hypothetical protein
MFELVVPVAAAVEVIQVTLAKEEWVVSFLIFLYPYLN